MSDEQMVAWLRSYAKLAVYLSDEERINAMADRIEALKAEVERLKDKLSVETEPSPYCPICGSCGDEGCCGSKRCMYPDTGIEALKAEVERLKDKLSVETEPSPYCPICGSCGDDGRMRPIQG